ncbi:MAG: NADH-quinone oxidoreductase subunit N, partial [Deltaproteobacteria bacterium]|nr:NADH-quinone oxidoreductase subunit N [Deltaproteobacteria bacterium]
MMEMLILPELIVLGTAFAIILADLFIAERHRPLLGWLAVLGLAAAAVLAVAFVPMEGQMFGGRFAMDSVTWWFKLLFLAAALITALLSMDLLEGRATAASTSRYGFRGEYYAILLFTVAGMLFLASARDLATLYVSLELTTIPLFILAAWKKDAFSTEAGLKYLVLGALASALLLYGLGIFYGLAGGATDLVSLGRLDPANAAFWLAAALVTAGVGFKMTIVPFHFWAADVYQGAPTPVTAYLSVASKGAGLVLMFHLFYRILGRSLGDLTTLLAVLAATTMTVGNLAAVTQKNIKRLMAFSAVSQAGYLIMGFIGRGGENVPAMIFYMVIYVVTNLAVFSAIIIHSNETGS